MKHTPNEEKKLYMAMEEHIKHTKKLWEKTVEGVEVARVDSVKDLDVNGSSVGEVVEDEDDFFEEIVKQKLSCQPEGKHRHQGSNHRVNLAGRNAGNHLGQGRQEDLGMKHTTERVDQQGKIISVRKQGEVEDLGAGTRVAVKNVTNKLDRTCTFSAGRCGL